jgi:hypothetical protein
MASSYSREDLIAALMAGGYMTRHISESPGDNYGEYISIMLAEGDKITCVVGETEDFDSYGKPGDVFFLGPSQFGDGGRILHSGGYGRGFMLLCLDGKWKANTFAGTIMKLIQAGKMTYEPGSRKAVT